MDYDRHADFAAAAEATAAEFTLAALEGLSRNLFSNTPAGSEKMQALRAKLDEARKLAEDVRAETQIAYSNRKATA